MNRYTVTFTGQPGAKGRVRTALKLMGFDTVRIEEAEVTASAPKVKPDNTPTQPHWIAATSFRSLAKASP